MAEPKPTLNCQKCGAEREPWKRCQPCKGAHAKARHLANPEEQKGRSREWYLANKEYAKARAKAWRAANPERAREIQRACESRPETKARRAAWSKAWYAANPEKGRAKAKKWFAANPERAKVLSRKHALGRYGLTIDAYDALLAAQGGACAICLSLNPGNNGSWHVDHDHSCCPGPYSCGQCIRGLLCSSCNLGLGKFGDSAEVLGMAVEYLEAPRKLRLVAGGVPSQST